MGKKEHEGCIPREVGTGIFNSEHEWRIVENVSREISKMEREYLFYCVYCLQEKSKVLKIK